MKNDGLATASMILGIIGMVLDFIPGLNFVAIILGILAVIFAIVSKNRIKASNGELGGNGMATAGLILGIIIVVLFILFMAACGALFYSASSLT